MNHNPYNLEVGERVILDAGYYNRTEVTIMYFTPEKMFAEVRNGNNHWKVMTYRLTPKIKT